jgi:hypothetical protein
VFDFSCLTLWQGANPQANLFLPLNPQSCESAVKKIHNFVASSISFSIVHVSFVSFKPTAGVQPSVEWDLQKLYAAANSAIA